MATLAESGFGYSVEGQHLSLKVQGKVLDRTMLVGQDTIMTIQRLLAKDTAELTPKDLTLLSAFSVDLARL